MGGRWNELYNLFAMTRLPLALNKIMHPSVFVVLDPFGFISSAGLCHALYLPTLQLEVFV